MPAHDFVSSTAFDFSSSSKASKIGSNLVGQSPSSESVSKICSRFKGVEKTRKKSEVLVVFDLNPKTSKKYSECRGCKSYTNEIKNPKHNPKNNAKAKENKTGMYALEQCHSPRCQRPTIENFFFSSMTEPSKKRLKPDLNYSTPTSTPSYSQRRSKEMVMLAPNGGFGPDGFRTPLPFPNTPNSIAGGTPTLGNQPFTGPVVPVRMF